MKTNLLDKQDVYDTLKKGLKKSRNTIVMGAIDDVVEVYFYSTCIVRVVAGKALLYNGGHETVTTKVRINEALATLGLPGIYQQNYDWYLPNGVRFQEGITYAQ